MSAANQFMTVSSILREVEKLTFARVSFINTENPNAPWVLCQKVDIQTLRVSKPVQSIFMNTNTFKFRYCRFRIGPFFTPWELDLCAQKPLKTGDIVLGHIGDNKKGVVFTSYLPNLWARPVANFFHFLVDSTSASRLYESRVAATRMQFEDRLTVRYEVSENAEESEESAAHGDNPVPKRPSRQKVVHDRRLLDLLVMILYDDVSCLHDMCRKPCFRSQTRYNWNLHDETMKRVMSDACGDAVHVPHAADFVESAALLLKDPAIVARFRSLLHVHFTETPDMYLDCVGQWLKDSTVLNESLIAELIDVASEESTDTES